MTVMALAYDFDGTLAPGNMQEHSFIPDLGMTPQEFWGDVEALKVAHNADSILTYMGHMIHMADKKNVAITRKAFTERGRSLPLFDGLTSWFTRINEFGEARGITVEHYILSAGIREIIEGTPIAPEIAEIMASSFKYDAETGNAAWVAAVGNATAKTQFLYRINKGCLALHDDVNLNRRMTADQRRVPFSNMVMIGDGPTDIASMSVVRKGGGHCIGVFDPKRDDRNAQQLLASDRVTHVAPADYRAGRALEKIILRIMDKVSAEAALKEMEAA